MTTKGNQMPAATNPWGIPVKTPCCMKQVSQTPNTIQLFILNAWNRQIHKENKYTSNCLGMGLGIWGK